MSRLRISKLVIPLAGKGTRMAPTSLVYPKELIHLVDRPAVQYLIEEAYDSGIREVIFIITPEKRAIKDYFSVAHQRKYRTHALQGKASPEAFSRLEFLSTQMKFRFIERTGFRRGDGHSLLLARPYIGAREPFAVTMGDLISAQAPRPLCELMDTYRRTGRPVISVARASLRALPSVMQKSGMIAGVVRQKGLYRVTRIIEKPGKGPAPSRLFLTGKYVLTFELFETLSALAQTHRTGELKLADALKEYCTHKELDALVCQGRILDVGNVDDYLSATSYLSTLWARRKNSK